MSSAAADSHKDAVTQRLEAGAAWLVRHRQQVGLALLALLAAGALGGFITFNLRRLRHLAWEQLSAAQAMATHGQRAQALQTVDQLLAAHRSGTIACQAHLFRADVLLLENRTDDALAAYREARRQAGVPELTSLAAAGEAAALEQARRWPEAEESHRAFIRDFPEHFLTARAYQSLGRLQMIQEKWTDAQATLERLVTLYPTTVWAKTAQEYLAVVKPHTAEPARR
jgi:tetratricopeptide (TPR) repeat protein